MSVADPDYALRLAKTVADIYGQATADALTIVAKRLATGIDDEDWAVAKLLELSALRNDTQAIVERLQVLGPEAVQQAIDDALAASVAETVRVLPDVDATLVPRTNTAAVEALARETIDKLGSTHTQILRRVDDIYRSVVAETAGSTVTGVATRRQTAQQVLDRFARRGIAGFVDNAGRHWELESYAEMATRTASTNAMVEGRLGVYESAGRDLVIVSDAPQECKLCRPWEGEILSLSGASVGDRTPDGRRVKASVRRARSEGLFHPNCRHDMRPYIAGLTKRMTDTSDPEGDKARRKQRDLERSIRAEKRVLAAALDDDARRTARRRVAAVQSKLRAHVDEHDLKRLPYREQIGRAR